MTNLIKPFNDWRDFLKEEEITELSNIDHAKREGQKQARRIYDRCRKRMTARKDD